MREFVLWLMNPEQPQLPWRRMDTATAYSQEEAYKVFKERGDLALTYDGYVYTITF